MKGIDEVLSFNIKRLRKAKGWTQADLAEVARISTGSIQAYEAKNRWPEKIYLDALAKAFKVQPWELFLETNTAGDKTRDEMIEILKDLAYEDLAKEIKSLRKENERLKTGNPHAASMIERLRVMGPKYEGLVDLILGADQSRLDSVLAVFGRLAESRETTSAGRSGRD